MCSHISASPQKNVCVASSIPSDQPLADHGINDLVDEVPLITPNAHLQAPAHAFFAIDAIPADSSNLIVSEFHYHPAEPTLPAETNISLDRDDYEFMELMNVANQPIDLTGVSISGITFAFADNTILNAGARLVIVKHQAAFEARYTAKLGSITYGP